MFYDVRFELVFFDNVLWQRLEPDCADNKNRWNNLEAEKTVGLWIKVSFNSANFEDQFSVR